MPNLRFALKSFFAILLLTFGVAAWSAPTITVASPKPGTVGTPTYFDATASTSKCAAGISAVRIYTAPGVTAFTTSSPHVETFLNLAPGTYNSVIQAWDNCGGLSRVTHQHDHWYAHTCSGIALHDVGMLRRAEHDGYGSFSQLFIS